MGGINHQTWVVYSCYTHIRSLSILPQSAYQVELLQKADFRAMPEGSVAKSFPTLHGAGAPVSKVVWARTFVPWHHWASDALTVWCFYHGLKINCNVCTHWLYMYIHIYIYICTTWDFWNYIYIYIHKPFETGQYAYYIWLLYLNGEKKTSIELRIDKCKMCIV